MPNYYTSPLVMDIASGTQILNSTSETIVAPDFTFSASDNRVYPGAAFNIRCWGEISNVVTTPGTLTLRVRWGGVAGTVLATSAAIALSTTARTSFTYSIDADLVFRTVGSAGSAICIGRATLNNVPVAADSAPQGVYTLSAGGANIPASVGSLDTTTAKALSVTAQFSVNTATTQLTNHIRILKSYGS